MKAQALLHFFFAVTLYPCGSCDLFFPVLFSRLQSDNEQLILGRYDEDVILPCSFTSGSEVVIHWKYQEKYVHTYYNGIDHLKDQDLKYASRTSLFHGEIYNGNASLTIKKLSLLDEGIYTCYVGTTRGQTKNKVVLKVGAFHTPLMKYENKNKESFLVCSILSVYPSTDITWKVNNTNVSEDSSEVTGTLGPFYIKSTLNISGSNSSFECAVENSLLNQTWRGQWTLGGNHWKSQGESISLWCMVSPSFSLPKQVTWFRIENGTYSVLDWHLHSSQDTSTNDPQLLWNRNIRGFPKTLKDLHASDSGEYLCNVSSTEYTILTVHRLHIAQSQGRVLWKWHPGILFSVLLLLTVLATCYCKVRRVSSGSEGIRRHRYSAEGDGFIQDLPPEEEVHGGSNEVTNHNSEMSPVSTDESVKNGDNFNKASSSSKKFSKERRVNQQVKSST